MRRVWGRRRDGGRRGRGRRAGRHDRRHGSGRAEGGEEESMGFWDCWCGVGVARLRFALARFRALVLLGCGVCLCRWDPSNAGAATAPLGPLTASREPRVGTRGRAPSVKVVAVRRCWHPAALGYRCRTVQKEANVWPVDTLTGVKIGRCVARKRAWMRVSSDARFCAQTASARPGRERNLQTMAGRMLHISSLPWRSGF
jgi:hypothetical protein